jgi:signal recognition particle receptor subunit beta
MDSATSELPAHRTPLRDTAETGLKIVVVGGFGVGKTTLVRSVSEIRPLNTEEVMTQAGVGVDDTDGLTGKNTTTVAFDFGRISLNDRMVLYLFGAPGQERFWFLWDRLFSGTLGAVVLVDTRRMDDSWYAIDRLEHHGTPFVVAVNRLTATPGTPWTRYARRSPSPRTCRWSTATPGSGPPARTC